MIVYKKPDIFKNGLTMLIFGLLILETIAVIISFDFVQFSFRPVVVVLILYLYWHTSKERKTLFFMTYITLLITSISILFKDQYIVTIGLGSIAMHRIMIIYFLIKLNKIRDYAPVLIAIVPFISLFSYLLSIADEIPDVSFYPLLLQNILVSIFAGIVLSNHFMNQNNKTVWLSIFGLLSTALYFIVFIEKCFLSNLPPTYFRPLGMILFAATYCAFYKSVIDIELEDAHSKAVRD